MDFGQSIFNKINASQKDVAAWPFLWVRALPDLLGILINRQCPQSLERLQLLTIEISLNPSPEFDALQKTDLVSYRGVNAVKPQYDTKRKVEGSPDVLVLKGDLMAGDVKMLSNTITYFQRGQHQFFRMPKIDLKTRHILELPAIEKAHVEEFFADMGQMNSLYVNDELCRLYGRRVFVPPHMMAWLIINMTLSVSKATHKNFYVSFFEPLPFSAMTFSYSLEPEALFAEFAVHQKVVMSLYAS